MKGRRGALDVTGRIDTTDAARVETEVARIYRALYAREPAVALGQAFDDGARLYSGEFPGYAGCDTGYHDLQHALEVTLAMARLLDGYERWRGADPAIGGRLFQFGVLCALFHDAGYIRRARDRGRGNGASYADRHVGRGARFLRAYLRAAGMPDLADAGSRMLRFTEFGRRVASIRTASALQARVGRFLGSADLVAQLADPCWLEKWRERLYPEIVSSGVALRRSPAGELLSVSSHQDLLRHAPRIFRTGLDRLEIEFGGAYEYGRGHFGGEDPYGDAIRRNLGIAERVAAEAGHSATVAAVDNRQSHLPQRA